MIDSLFLLQLLIDFGLLVLIFLVQLAIYPSFIYFKREDLLRWHKKYTKAIAIVVGPLMILQLALSGYTAFILKQYQWEVVHFALILLVWLSTAFLFVPIHNRIAANSHTDRDLRHLVNRNWIRVVQWIMILSTSVLHYYTTSSL